MNDLISRQDAIDKIREVYEYEFPTASGEFDEFVVSIIPNILRNLPSEEPERKHGEWLPHPHEREWDVCSVCGIGCKRREFEMQFGQERFTEYSYQYCPNCGARMTRGEE